MRIIESVFRLSQARYFAGILFAVCSFQLLTGINSANAEQLTVEHSQAQFTTKIQPLLTKFCLDCHTGQDAEAGLDLEKFQTRSSILAQREHWEKIVKRIQIQSMPPKDADALPTDKEREAILAWFDDALYGIDCSGEVNPGRVTIRRLNRNEYNNTIRDLLGIDFKPARNFPSDDVGYGFDNIGDVLSLPPLLMEKYLDAAEEISEKAIFANTPDSYPWREIPEKNFQKKGAVTFRKEWRRVSFTRHAGSGEFELKSGWKI